MEPDPSNANYDKLVPNKSSLSDVVPVQDKARPSRASTNKFALLEHIPTYYDSPGFLVRLLIYDNRHLEPQGSKLTPKTKRANTIS